MNLKVNFVCIVVQHVVKGCTKLNFNVGKREMNGKEYQELAMRTYDGYAMNRLSSNVMGATFYETVAILNGVLGLTGEAGEVSDLIKKGIFHEKGIDR